MSMPDIAKAISDALAMHAAAHPEDAARSIDGVVANQCLMDTMGFADALSKAGVRYLAASPETMLAPGVPSDVAHVIASHEDDPKAMAKAVLVSDVMRTRYDAGERGGFGPAAAFDVLDLDPAKMRLAEANIKAVSMMTSARRPAPNGDARYRCVRTRARSKGMVRFPEASKDMPWQRRSSGTIAFYDTLRRRRPFGRTPSQRRRRRPARRRSRPGISAQRKRRVRAVRRRGLLRRRRTDRSPSNDAQPDRSVGVGGRRRNQ